MQYVKNINKLSWDLLQHLTNNNIEADLLQGDKDELEYTKDTFNEEYSVADRNNPTAEETLRLVKTAKVPFDIEFENFSPVILFYHLIAEMLMIQKHY